jgi:hypothetical protein
MSFKCGPKRFEEASLFHAGTDHAVRPKDSRDNEVVDVPDGASGGYKCHRKVNRMATYPVEPMLWK